MQIYLNQKHFDTLLSFFKVKTIDEVRVILESNIIPQTVDETLKIERARLTRNNAIKIERLNHLSLIRDFNMSPDLALKVTRGEIKFVDVISPNIKTQTNYEKPNISWTHHCKSAGRDVEYREEIVECKWCGVRKVEVVQT